MSVQRWSEDDTKSYELIAPVWLREAGFAAVDCYWLRAGHAIYGGYRSAGDQRATIGFDDALRLARQALGQPA